MEDFDMERKDINEVRTEDVKRMKLASSFGGEGGLTSKNEPVLPEESVQEMQSEDSTLEKGDIALVYEALESSPFTLDGDPAFGLCLRARRDLKAGELLYDEVPAFFGPSADLVQDYSTPLCLGCCVVMNVENSEHRCSDCGWPICGPDCDNLAHHKANECELFSKNNVTFPPNVEIQPCYKAIAIIRGLLLKERDPKAWQQLMTLQWETQLQTTPFPDFEELKNDFGLEDFGEEEDWMRILGIINVNSYSFQRVEKKEGSPSFGECLFPIYSLMCHSCAPNCTWAITYSPTFTMKVRPTVDIPKGGMLFLCYNNEFSRYGFLKRQEKIRERAEFDCKCQRCLSVSDLGTNLAAVKCFKCKVGFMLPEDANDFEADWKCDKCPYTMCPSFISSFAESLYEQSDMAEEEAEESGQPVVTIFEKFIETNSGITVHPNHWVIAEAVQAIVKLQCPILPQLSEEDIDKFINHCEYLLKIRDVLAPGLSNGRGMLHHNLARAMFRKLELRSDALPSDDKQKEMEKLNRIQNLALAFWKENPHYDSLIGSYTHEPQLLITEAKQIATQLNIPVTGDA